MATVGSKLLWQQFPPPSNGVSISDALAQFSARLQVTEVNVNTTVKRDELIARINTSGETVLISGERIGVVGTVTFADWHKDVTGQVTGVIDPSYTQIRGGVIKTGKVQNTDGTAWVDLDATGNAEFIRSTAVSIKAGGNFTFGSGNKTLSWDGTDLKVGGTALIAGVPAAEVVANASAGAGSGSYSHAILEADLALGVKNILGGLTGNYRLTVDTDNHNISIAHKNAIYNGTVAVGNRGTGQTGLMITASGIGMGFNHPTTGVWNTSIAIDGSTGNATFTGTVNASAGNFAGTVNAITGSFGAVTLATSGSISSGQTAYDTGTGFWLGDVAGVKKFSIGNATGGKLTWNGTTLTVNGTITGTSIIAGATASDVVTGAAAGATSVQPDAFTNGSQKILSATSDGANSYKVDSYSIPGVVLFGHSLTKYAYTGGAEGYTPVLGKLRTGLAVSANGIAMGYNRASDGNWVDSITIDGATGSATFSGELNSATGTFGAVTLASAGSISSGQTAYDTGTGFWLGDVTGTKKFSIGNAAGNKLTWDGSALTVTGAITSTSTIAGTTATTVVTGAAAGATSVQPGSLTDGSRKILSATTDGNNSYKLDTNTTAGLVLIGHSAVNYGYTGGAQSYTPVSGKLRAGIAISANGIAMGYNRASDGNWVDSVVIDGTTGAATFTGALSAATGTFAGSLSAATGTFSGALSAATGTFGAVTLASAGSISSGQTTYDTGTGFWLGDVSGTKKFSIGNSAGNKLTWDGSALTINGSISGTSTINGTDASTVVLGAAAGATSVQPATLTDGSRKILSATNDGTNTYKIDTSSVAGVVLIGHGSTNYGYTGGAQGYTPVNSKLHTGLAISANGIAMGYNRTSDGNWVDSIVLNGTTGSATFSGALSAVTGTFGAVTLASAGSISSGQTAYDTGTGFWLGDVSGTKKFSIGNSAGNKLTWDGTTLSITGALSSTSTIDGVSTSGVKNSSITVNGSGVLTGIGTSNVIVDNSKVTLGTLGYTGATNATANTYYNQIGDPGGINGDVWYDTGTTTLKIKVGGSWVPVGDITSGKTAANITGQGAFATVAQITSGNQGTLIAANSLAADRLVANSITASQIAAGAITAAKIAAGTITATEIAANTITAAKIAAGTITATEIASGAVTASKISVDGSILIGSAGNIRQGQTAFDTGTGFWLGDAGGTTKFSIGNSAANRLTWNGSTLTIVGDVSLATVGGGGGTTMTTVKATGDAAYSLATTANTNANNAVSTANSAVTAASNAQSTADSKLSSSSSYTLTGVQQISGTGGVMAGNVTWDSSTGAVTGGTGVVITQNGICGVQSGVTKFSVDASGNASFKGDITGATGTFSGDLNVSGNATFAGLSTSSFYGYYSQASTLLTKACVAAVNQSNNAGGVACGYYGSVNSSVTAAYHAGVIGQTSNASTSIGIYGEGGFGGMFTGLNAGCPAIYADHKSGGYSVQAYTTGSVAIWASKDIQSAQNISAYSDRRLKKDLVIIGDALNRLCSLTGYTYERVDSGIRQTGLIAQDVQEILPEAVTETEDGTLTLAYGNLMGLVVNAIKELRQEVRAMR